MGWSGIVLNSVGTVCEVSVRTSQLRRPLVIMSSHGSKGLQRTVVEECSEKSTIKD